MTSTGSARIGTRDDDSLTDSYLCGVADTVDPRQLLERYIVGFTDAKKILAGLDDMIDRLAAPYRQSNLARLLRCAAREQQYDQPP